MRACVGVDALPPGLLTRARGADARTRARAQVEDTLASILSGELEPSALPVIACVEWTDRASGEVRRASLNNRRLWVLKQAADAGKLPGGVVRVRIKVRAPCVHACWRACG